MNYNDAESKVIYQCSSLGLLAEEHYDLVLLQCVSRPTFHNPPSRHCSPPDQLAIMSRWAVNTTSLLRPLQPANFCNASSRQAFGRGNTRSTQNLRDRAAQSPTTANAPPVPNLPNSPSISSAYSATSDEVYQEQPKKFLNERYAKCSVKGNFLTLAAQPKNVELGEWLAHQGTRTTERR